MQIPDREQQIIQAHAAFICQAVERIQGPGAAVQLEALRGDAQALALISQMAEQMSKVGGDMSRVAAVIRPLINGERDPDRLCARLDARAQRLVLQILDELGKLDLH